MKSYPTMLLAGAAIALAADDGSAASAVASADTFRQLKVNDYEFQVKIPYAEGHSLNANEAGVLNQTYAENVRNNVAGKIRAAKEAFLKVEGNTEDGFSLEIPVEGGGTLRSQLQEYANNYEFGARVGRTSEPVDPVQREARSIAREILSAAFKEQNIRRKDLDDDTYEEALNTVAQSEDVQKEAERRVKQASKIGAGGLNIAALLGNTSAEGEDSQPETEGAEG